MVNVGGHSRLPERIVGEFGGAVDAVEAFWGPDWPRSIDVVVTGSDADFAAHTGAPDRDWSGVAAVAVADGVDPAGRTASGQRIVFGPRADAMSDAALRIVLRHELFHLAARADTAVDAPVWLTEGVADFVARPPAARPGGNLAARLPTDAELDAGEPERSAAYDRAWWFARFVAEEFGPPALRALYLRACGVSHRDVAGAMSEVLGTDFGELMVRWQRWLTS